MTESLRNKSVVIVGAGPAGLTAAYELNKQGVECTVLEKDNVVGGISRTAKHNGYHFDIGGHRFFTKVGVVEDMWHEVLGDQLIRRNRLSRIYYKNKFFNYPLKPANALLGLGFINSCMLVLSYMWVRVFPIKEERSFEDWITNRFGKRLYLTFFKTYTEKVWGIPCTQISADWAAQRIKGLSLVTAIKNALLKPQNESKDAVVKTLIDSFEYPISGPGQMWETVADVIEKGHCKVQMQTEVTKIRWSDGAVKSIETLYDGQSKTIDGTDFVSSMPIRELIDKLDPPAPESVRKAGAMLNYRDFLTVALIVNKKELFPDNWIYIHDPTVKVGRVQNFKNWSPHMVPDPEKSCVGLEYFCFEGDNLWETSDDELIALGTQEMDRLGLVQASDVEDGAVVRMPKAYPVYDDVYQDALDTIRAFVDKLCNLQLVGRNGMHKYNNQDHSMLTAMLAAKNIMGADLDLWAVNADQDYHEEISKDESEAANQYTALNVTQPQVPQTLSPSAIDAAIIRTFSRLDKIALAIAMGAVSGLYLMLATLFLVIKGGSVVGPHLALLGQYFNGFTVTVPGAFVGLIYGFVWGFLLGWLIAYLHNALLGMYLYQVKRKSERVSVQSFLDYI